MGASGIIISNMGLFDDFTSIIKEIAEPLAQTTRDITDTVLPAKDDAVDSFSQVSDTVQEMTDQGSAAVGDLKDSVSNILPPKADQ